MDRSLGFTLGTGWMCACVLLFPSYSFFLWYRHLGPKWVFPRLHCQVCKAGRTGATKAFLVRSLPSRRQHFCFTLRRADDTRNELSDPDGARLPSFRGRGGDRCTLKNSRGLFFPRTRGPRRLFPISIPTRTIQQERRMYNVFEMSSAVIEIDRSRQPSASRVRLSSLCVK